MNRAFTIILLLIGFATVNGQSDRSKIKFDLSARYRFELWNGMNSKNYGDEQDGFIRCQVLKHWQLSGVFGYFMHGELSPIDNKLAKDAEWFALQVLFTF